MLYRALRFQASPSPGESKACLGVYSGVTDAVLYLMVDKLFMPYQAVVHHWIYSQASKSVVFDASIGSEVSE